MRPLLLVLALVAVNALTLSLAAPAAGQSSPPHDGGHGTPALTIRLAHDSERERATRDELLALAARYDLSPWVRTTEILIDQDQIPHSHPVLTLHTRHQGDPDALLAVFLHEQLHWVAIERGEARDRAMARFRDMFGDLPPAAEGGARDDRSTLLHLVVCDLELAATAALLGEATARRVLGANTHYQWIYRQILENPDVRKVNREAGLLP